MVRDPELAADLTQDAFVKAYKAYDSLEKPENARAWLYQIAHRVALDHIRRQKIVRFFPWTGESPRRGPVGRAPRHGRPHLGRPPAGARADAGAAAGGPPPRRAPRPHGPRARRGPRRQPRRRPGAAHPRAREPPPGARRGARGRSRRAAWPRPPGTSDDRHRRPRRAQRRLDQPHAAPARRLRSASTVRSTPTKPPGSTSTSRRAMTAPPSPPTTRRQRLELRALREHAPAPPRDLWARTRGRDRARVAPPSSIPPTLPGVDVQAVRPSRRCAGRGNRRRNPDLLPVVPRRCHDHARRHRPTIAVATPSPDAVAPTPLAVGPRDVAYLSVGRDGTLRDHAGSDQRGLPAGRHRLHVRPASIESRKDIGPLASPEIGLRDRTAGRSSSWARASEGTRLVVVAVPDGGRRRRAERAIRDAREATPSDEPDPSSPPAIGRSLDRPRRPTPTAEPETTAPPSDEPSPTPSETGRGDRSRSPRDLRGHRHDRRVRAGWLGVRLHRAACRRLARPGHLRLDRRRRPPPTPSRRITGRSSARGPGDDIVGSSARGLRRRHLGRADGDRRQRATTHRSRCPDAGLAWRPAVDPERRERRVLGRGRSRRADDGTVRGRPRTVDS